MKCSNIIATKDCQNFDMDIIITTIAHIVISFMYSIIRVFEFICACNLRYNIQYTVISISKFMSTASICVLSSIVLSLCLISCQQFSYFVPFININH